MEWIKSTKMTQDIFSKTTYPTTNRPHFLTSIHRQGPLPKLGLIYQTLVGREFRSGSKKKMPKSLRRIIFVDFAYLTSQQAGSYRHFASDPRWVLFKLLKDYFSRHSDRRQQENRFPGLTVNRFSWHRSECRLK